MKTQLERAVQFVKVIADSLPASSTGAIRYLSDIVDTAQNGPPEGEGDGSFNEESWTRARDIRNTADRLHSLCQQFLWEQEKQ